MKNLMLLLTIGLIAIGLMLTYFFFLPNEKSPTKTIAIITTLSHPALNDVRKGFISRFQEIGNEEYVIKNFNAEGSMQQANLIARQVANNKSVVAIFAIGTLAAQTIAKVAKERPVVIAAVSDPKAIVPNRSSKNVFGFTDSIDPDFQLSAILRLWPNIKSISFLYSPHEANSASMVSALERSAKSRKLVVSLVGVAEPQQIMMASMDACKKSDAVLIPLDNQLVASMPAVIKATKGLDCPIITSNESPIYQGATLAFGVDYKVSGQKSADLLNEVLTNAKRPEDIGFIDPDSVDLFLNRRVIKEKNLDISESSGLTLIEVDGEKR